MAAISAILRNIPLLSRMTQQQLDTVAAISERCGFEAGQMLVEAGAEADAAYYLIDGLVECETESAEGICNAAPIPPGGTLLELAMIVEIDVSATCTARGPAKVLKIPREKMHELMQSDPLLTDAVIEALTIRLKDMADTMREAGQPFEELQRSA